MALYIDLATFKLTIHETATDRDALMTNAITTASRQIDRWCGRRFDQATEPSPRLYTIAGRAADTTLLVDDIATANDLAVEAGDVDAFTPITGFTTTPDNALPLGRPITGIRVEAGWTRGTTARVTARWGWPAVPDEIAQATLIQALRLFKRKDSPEGVLGNSEWGTVRVARVDPDVAALLSPYVLPGFA